MYQHFPDRRLSAGFVCLTTCSVFREAVAHTTKIYLKEHYFFTPRYTINAIQPLYTRNVFEEMNLSKMSIKQNQVELKMTRI